MPTTPDSHLLKFARAREHFEALIAEIEAYADSLRSVPLDQRWVWRGTPGVSLTVDPARPHATTWELDPETGDHILRLKTVRQPPQRLSLLVGDCLQNLRSSLDHLVWQLIYRHSEKDSSASEFPIFLNRDEYLTGRGRRVKPGVDKVRLVPSAAQARIEALQPYNRTDGPAPLHPLWLLHSLNNRDKHRVLHLTVHSVIGADVQLLPHPALDYEIISRTTGPVEDGGELLRLRLKRKDPAVPGVVDVNVSTTLQIAFDKRGPGKGLPVIQAMMDIGRAVQQVFTDLEPFL